LVVLQFNTSGKNHFIDFRAESICEIAFFKINLEIKILINVLFSSIRDYKELVEKLGFLIPKLQPLSFSFSIKNRWTYAHPKGAKTSPFLKSRYIMQFPGLLKYHLLLATSFGF